MTNSTRRGWGVSVTPRPLFTPGKDSVPLLQEAEWAPGPIWTGAENLAPTGIRSPDRPVHIQSLSWLRCPVHIRKWWWDSNYNTINITFLPSRSVRRSLHFANFYCYWHTSYEIISSSQILSNCYTFLRFIYIYFYIYMYTFWRYIYIYTHTHTHTHTQYICNNRRHGRIRL